MSKKFFTTFCSLSLLALVFLPSIAMAGGSYSIIPFTDTGGGKPNGKFDVGEATFAAKVVSYEGFVPCGVRLCPGKWDNGTCILEPPATKVIEAKENSCQLCHMFVMANNLVSFLVVKIVPILAALMMVVGGVMLYFAGANPSLLGRSKTLVKGVAIGLFLVYGSYILVNTFLLILGAAEINSISQIYKNGVFSIKCPVYIPN